MPSAFNLITRAANLDLVSLQPREVFQRHVSRAAAPGQGVTQPRGSLLQAWRVAVDVPPQAKQMGHRHHDLRAQRLIPFPLGGLLLQVPVDEPPADAETVVQLCGEQPLKSCRVALNLP